jgi:hypothetical protein
MGLNEEGLYGPCRLMLRYVLEGLILAKYVSLHPDNRLAKKWSAQTPIYIGKEVFARIQSPEMVALEEVWSQLCDLSHATACSQQISIKDNTTFGNALTNVGLSSGLCTCLYHLYGQHYITPRARYYAGYLDLWSEISDHNSNLRTILGALKLMQGPDARRFVAAYKAQWVIS